MSRAAITPSNVHWTFSVRLYRFSLSKEGSAMRRRRLSVTPSRPLTPSLQGKEGETMYGGQKEKYNGKSGMGCKLAS